MTVAERLDTWIGNRSDSELSRWLIGRSWQVRLPLILISAWYLVTWIDDVDRSSWFSGLNLGIHEAGHLLTGAFGHFICAAAGSFFQCLAPVIAAVLFIRQRDFSAVGFCFTWLASNLFSVAQYVADAPYQRLQLVTVGSGEAQHDWAFLLGEMNLLGAAGLLAGCLRLIGYVTALLAIAWGSWVLYRMAQEKR